MDLEKAVKNKQNTKNKEHIKYAFFSLIILDKINNIIQVNKDTCIPDKANK